jgi:hypothetical protein
MVAAVLGCIGKGVAGLWQWWNLHAEVRWQVWKSHFALLRRNCGDVDEPKMKIVSSNFWWNTEFCRFLTWIWKLMTSIGVSRAGDGLLTFLVAQLYTFCGWLEGLYKLLCNFETRPSDQPWEKTLFLVFLSYYTYSILKNVFWSSDLLCGCCYGTSCCYVVGRWPSM